MLVGNIRSNVGVNITGVADGMIIDLEHLVGRNTRVVMRCRQQQLEKITGSITQRTK